ncbi:alpha-1,3-mannosyl-glycoprotein 2-beta-N-acetylglucosaminyltransferase-like isoform X2 [Convolutriloba macropyga]|uniref:alpha-1,3-mannosyl-glycoprotein 2-beta-N-acetylglucosaminyltransferase-like isoform X2 n=1 Tax=Convolutriloba macropyga TaxID=536237 RepID=UPI003F51B840
MIKKFRKRHVVPYMFIAVFLLLLYIFLRQDRKADFEAIKGLEDRIAELQGRLDSLKGSRKDVGANQQQIQEDLNKRPVNPRFGEPRAPEAGGAAESVDVVGLTLPILLMACDRKEVSKALDSLLQYNPDLRRFPIIVSQDCGHEPTAKIIAKYTNVRHIKHVNNTAIVPQKKGQNVGYYKISRHYRWALTQVFDVYNYEAVIIVEDDLEVSPDFFEYFLATYPLLKDDPTLFCVSAWNDNGKSNFIDLNQPEMLYRTDFFPGLGWMLTKSTFKQLQPKWPAAYWDDWVREPGQMGQGAKSCIRPEISRTSTFGKKGVSNGQFFNEHLKFINHATTDVHFTQLDLSYLFKNNFDSFMDYRLNSVPVISLRDLKNRITKENEVKVIYKNNKEFQSHAKAVGIMSDLKSGIPRTAYRGVVTFVYMGIRVYFVPAKPWAGYQA